MVRFLQNDGDVVEKDKPYVEIEAMKMIMAVKATETGVITHNLSPGSILSTGDLIASLKLADPSKVKQILKFKDRLSVLPLKTDMTAEEAQEKISLAIDGYDNDFTTALSVFLKSATLDSALSLLTTQLKKFLDTEKVFSGQEESTVVSSLAKTNKDKLLTIIPTLVARKQQKFRTSVVLALLRQLEFLPERFAGYLPEQLPADLRSILDGLAALQASPYNREVTLKAKQLVEDSLIPPFQSRLDSLKASMATSNLIELSRQPNIAVSVDLLVVLMSDKDPKVRRAAAEVYLRRVYRAHNLKTLDISESEDGILSATWSFTVRDSTEGPLRKGYMSMIPSIDSLGSAIARASSQLTKSGYNVPVNVLHVGFKSPVAATDDEYAKKAQAALADFKSQLEAMDVRAVSLFSLAPTTKVNYFNFYSETSFNEDEISRNMRPTMPQLLELNRLSENHLLTRLPTVGRNSQMYIGKSREVGKGKGEAPQQLFLRSISNSAGSVTQQGADRVLLLAMDELDRALLDPRVSADTVSSRVFMNILPDVPMDVKSCIESFQRIMDGLIAKYATRLLQLRVDEIEVKIRVVEPSGEVIPIRLIASSSTGGWLTREAYREYLDPVNGQTQQYCTLMGNQDICVLDPYPTAGALQLKRTSARRVGSTYAGDFLGLMEVALINSWAKHLEKVAPGSSPYSTFHL